MAQQIGLTFRAFTPTATNAATTHPVTNVALVTKWRRTVRSTSTGAWNLDLDFGTTTPLDGLFVHHTNFGKVMLAKSDNGSSWTDLYAAATDVLIDDRCTPPVRRKTWLPASAWLSAFNARYLRITPSVADAGATYWEIGGVACPVLENMVQNFGSPFPHRAKEAISRLPYASGGSEVNVEGPTILGFSLKGPPWKAAALTQIERLRAVGEDGAVFFFENLGDRSKAYLLKRVAAVEIARRGAVFDGGFEFEECV